MIRTQTFPIAALALALGLSNAHAGIISSSVFTSEQGHGVTAYINAGSLTHSSASPVAVPALATPAPKISPFTLSNASDWTFVSTLSTPGIPAGSSLTTTPSVVIEETTFNTGIHAMVASAPVVPEPASLSMLALGAACLLRRRR